MFGIVFEIIERAVYTAIGYKQPSLGLGGIGLSACGSSNDSAI